MPMPRVQWSADKVDQLKRLWAAGDYASIIAHKMGITRNAVIGKAHRLGLAARRDRPVPGAPRKRPHLMAPRPRITAQRPQRQPSNQAMRRKPPRIEVLRIDDSLIAPEQRLSVLTLTFGRCHFPVGDPADAGFFYCGAPVQTSDDCRQYCTAHRRRMYQPLRPRGIPSRPFLNRIDHLYR